MAGALAQRRQRRLDLIARYGGEEFAVILPKMNRDQSLHLAEAMRRSLESMKVEHEKSEHAAHVTVSIGLATHTDQVSRVSSSDIAQLVSAADRALYSAKRAGRNRVVLHEAEAVTPAT